MISIVIPTLNAAPELARCLAALAPAALDGLVKEAIVADGGSNDETVAVAQAAGATVVEGARGRGAQVVAGAARARGRWLLFLHADTVLSEEWLVPARALMADAGRAGVFRLRFDAADPRARLIAAGAMLRTRLFRLPYGDQGLLISRALYDEVGGYKPLALFEDVDFVERLVRAKGRASLCVLSATATTSATRYERNGYFRQAGANLLRLARYKMGAAPATLAERYR